MKRWLRLKTSTLCGGCAKSLPEGSPALSIPLPGVKRERIRGECCAGAAPPDLPPLEKIERHKSTKRMTRLTASRPEWIGYKDSE